MDLYQKRNKLKTLIKSYLNNQRALEDLQRFAWEIIAYFNKTNKNLLPSIYDFEKECWYAIWQIQHLADQEHEKAGITRQALLEALDFLEKREKIPETFNGLRP